MIQGLSHQHPALKSSVRPDKPEERSKVISALNTLWIEDPSLSFSINSYSDELEISLYGLTQKEIIQTLLEERFSVKVHFDEIKTIYKERPVKKVNKIIQIEVPPNPYWATIGLTLEPLPLGTGLQIESDISYGYLNHSFQNAVFEGIRMSCQSGLHEAEGGTLFLDEVGNLALETQQMLLRAIQERRYRPVGDKADRSFNVRIIAATNEDLEAAVSEKRFRQDLLYRLHDFGITVPPLRDCQEDIMFY